MSQFHKHGSERFIDTDRSFLLFVLRVIHSPVVSLTSVCLSVCLSSCCVTCGVALVQVTMSPPPSSHFSIHRSPPPSRDCSWRRLASTHFRPQYVVVSERSTAAVVVVPTVVIARSSYSQPLALPSSSTDRQTVRPTLYNTASVFNSRDDNNDNTDDNNSGDDGGGGYGSVFRVTFILLNTITGARPSLPYILKIQTSIGSGWLKSARVSHFNVLPCWLYTRWFRIKDRLHQYST